MPMMAMTYEETLAALKNAVRQNDVPLEILARSIVNLDRIANALEAIAKAKG